MGGILANRKRSGHVARSCLAAVLMLVAGACSDDVNDAMSVPAGRYAPDGFAVPFVMEMPAGWTEEVADEDLVLLAGPDRRGAVVRRRRIVG